VTDSTGRALSFPYRLETLPKGTAVEVPHNCGWGGSSTGGDQFTLTYGQMPTEVDAGALPDSGASVRDSGATGVDASAPKDAGASSTAPAGSGGTGGMIGLVDGGAGGASGIGGGNVSPTGGAPGPGVTSSDGGCSCLLASTDGLGGGRLLVVAGLLAALRFRRRVRDRRP
jgi:hypothetical protein